MTLSLLLEEKFSNIKMIRNTQQKWHELKKTSPDLNPIEKLWSIFKQKVEQQNPSSKEQRKKIICEEWRNISL